MKTTIHVQMGEYNLDIPCTWKGIQIAKEWLDYLWDYTKVEAEN